MKSIGFDNFAIERNNGFVQPVDSDNDNFYITSSRESYTQIALKRREFDELIKLLEQAKELL